ncbi:MAG: DUF192 domain-containing protein [Maritalea sp.]
MTHRRRTNILMYSHFVKHLARGLCAFFLAIGLSACLAGEDQLTLVTQNGEHRFSIEVVDTDETRAKGLMYRTSLAPDAGMLFDFIEARPVAFWMRNTLIPLDMIFISAAGNVVNIHSNAKPHDPTSIPSDGPVRFVLEIAGGRARQIDLRVGDQVIHPRIDSSE